MRTVFTNQQCAHVWAQLSQPHGRSDSMKFDGARAYSYNTVVAHLVRLREDNPQAPEDYVALFVPNRWSMTTARHLFHYRDAASRYRQFEVPSVSEYGRPEPDHKQNVAYLVKQYRKEAEALMRVPADSYRLKDFITGETLQDLESNVRGYCGAFKLDCPELNVESDLRQIYARRDRILQDPKRAAKMVAAANARAAREAEKARINVLAQAEKIVEWRNGADVYLRNVPDMLRLTRGGIVQTSRGAEVPLADAQRVLTFYAMLRKSGDVYHPEPDARMNVGNFTVTEITESGTVRVGCHTFSAAEIEAFAKLVQS
jgi:hypothetical protein